MFRFASLLVAGVCAFGLVGCEVDVDDGEPDVIDDREPGVDVEVDDEPDVLQPDVDVDVDSDPPDTLIVPDDDLNPPGTAGEGELLDPEPDTE